jgi:hypothetical protein
VSANIRPPRRLWLVYPAWILVCAVLFLVLRELPDPSRQTDRLDRDSAAKRAVMHLMNSDRERFGGYEAVHTAFSPAGELGPEARWVVLCDRKQGGALRDAIVVEMRAADGKLIRIRPPVLP